MKWQTHSFQDFLTGVAAIQRDKHPIADKQSRSLSKGTKKTLADKQPVPTQKHPPNGKATCLESTPGK